MAEVRITERNGSERTIQVSTGQPLMEALRDANTGIQGTCGGACSCGTCHVYIGAAWADKLPPKSEDEQMMLDALGDLVELRPTSRLACQVPLTEALSGMDVVIAPEA